MDKVFIEALEIECTIGIHEWEQRIKQVIVLDIEIGFDSRKPGLSDAIEDTIDYVALIDLVREIAARRAFKLLESFGEAVCEGVLCLSGVQSIAVRLTKHVPSLRVGAVGVMMAREKALG
jgi:dihydroneopterin aldolase